MQDNDKTLEEIQDRGERLLDIWEEVRSNGAAEIEPYLEAIRKNQELAIALLESLKEKE